MTNTIKLYKHLSELSVYLSNTQCFTPPLDFWGSGKPPCCSPFHSYSLLMRKRRYPVVSIHRHFPSPGEVRAACAQLPMAAHQGSLHRRRRWNQRSMVENGGRIHRRQCLFLPSRPRFRPHFAYKMPRNHACNTVYFRYKREQNHARNDRISCRIGLFYLNFTRLDPLHDADNHCRKPKFNELPAE